MAESRIGTSVVGTIVGHYRLLSPLGRGAMGEVYLGEDVRLGRRVAVKVLPAEACCDPASIERFVREAQIVSSLNHPNICTLHDIGQHDGRQFMVMELLEGETLAARVARGPLPVDEILALAADIASALEAALRQGVVHRDIKPANLFVTASGLKVLDFGVAKLSDAAAARDTTRGGSEPLTMLGAAIGTMAYMSPEQARGEAIDGRSDLFSLGVVLYEMATGRPPFTGATAAVVFEGLLTKTPPPPSSKRVGLPDGFDALVMRALEKSPETRQPSAEALRAEIQAVRRGITAPPLVAAAGPVAAPPGTPAGVRVSSPRRWWWLAAPVATAAVVAGVVAWQSASAPALQSKDPVVLAALTNRTGDTMFDDTLGEVLAVQLRQSPFLNLVPDQRIQATLRMMERDPATPLDASVGREVCQRVGAKALLTSTIAKLGESYVLTLGALDCVTGEPLAEEQVEASRKDDVLKQLGVAARDLRERLGESLPSIARYDANVEEATTTSLEALKAYSQAMVTRRTQGDRAALAFYRRAVELDPGFALAHARLGTAYSNLSDVDGARRHTDRAYELRGKVSELERLYIEARYHTMHDDTAKAIEAYRVTQATYPNDYTSRVNLGILLRGEGQTAEALQLLREAVRISPEEPNARINLATTLIHEGQFAEARREAEAARALRDDSTVKSLLMTVAVFSGDAELERQQLDRIAAIEDRTQVLPLLWGLAAHRGQFAESQRLLAEIERTFGGAGLWPVVGDLRGGSAAFAAGVGLRSQAQELAVLLERDHAVDATADDRLFVAALLRDAALARRSLPAALAFRNGASGDAAASDAMRALASMAAGDDASAIATLGPVRSKANQTDFRLLHGMLSYALRKYDDAISDFEWIRDHGRRELSPQFGLARLGLARTFEAAGRTDDARRAYRDFLDFWKSADPDLPVIVEATRALARLGT